MADAGGDAPPVDAMLATPGSIANDEFKRGLHLIAPEWRVFEEKINALNRQMQEVKKTLAEKETIANVDQVKVEIAAMTPILKQKADETEVQRLQTHLQQLHGNLAGKAESSVVEHLSQQYSSLSSSSVTKGELAGLSARLEQVSSKIDTKIHTIQNTLDTFDVVEMKKKLDALSSSAVTPTQLRENLTPLKNMLDTLNATLLRKANSDDLSSLRTTLDGVQEAVKGKAEEAIVEQMATQYRQMNKALTQKAEYTEVEDLRSKIKGLLSTLEHKAGQSEVDALSVTLKGLSAGLASTIDEKVEQKVMSKYKADIDELTGFVNKSVADLKSSISDIEKNLKTKAALAELEKLAKQIQVMNEALIHKDSKLDEFGKQLAEFKKLIALKSDDSRVDKVVKELGDLTASVTKSSSELHSLSTSVEDCKKSIAKKAEDVKVDKLASLIQNLADKTIVDRLVKQMDSVADTLAKRSGDLDELQRRVQETLSLRGIRLDELEKRLSEIHDLSAILAKIDKLDNLSGQVDLLFNKISSKADTIITDELVNNLRGKADNRTVDHLGDGLNTTNRRIRMLIDTLINTIRRYNSSTRVRVGGGFLTDSLASDAPPDTELINMLEKITAEDLSPRGPRETLAAFGTDSPLSSPRIDTRGERFEVPTGQMRKELDDVYIALSRKADKTALSTLAAEFQRLSDFTMTQVLQAPTSLPPGSLRPQSARGGVTRPTTPRGGLARQPRFAA